VPDGIIAALKAREIEGHIDPDLRATFASFGEVLGEMTDRERIALLFEMLDRSVLAAA
jgi:hypothetical protein